MFGYANPAKFMRLSGRVLPVTAVLAALCIGAGLYLGFTAPPDYQQGSTVLMLFIHVPAANIAFLAYGVIAVASIFSLVQRHLLADAAARAAAPLGALFTALGLITGSLWGRPMWGAYWVWDARLTSFLLLLFIYLGYMALWNAIEDETRAARAAAILALVGAVDLPIIYFSVYWWNTLHQGESIMSGNIAPVFLAPLMLMMAGYVLLFLTLLMARIRTEIVNRRARALMQRSAA
jgi:heme exporter protein C